MQAYSSLIKEGGKVYDIQTLNAYFKYIKFTRKYEKLIDKIIFVLNIYTHTICTNVGTNLIQMYSQFVQICLHISHIKFIKEIQLIQYLL